MKKVTAAPQRQGGTGKCKHGNTQTHPPYEKGFCVVRTSVHRSQNIVAAPMLRGLKKDIRCIRALSSLLVNVVFHAC